MEELRPNERRAKIAITLIWIVMFLEIISIISSYFQNVLLHAHLNGEQITLFAINANDSREQFIAILYIIVYLISGITFIQWFRRAYYNLHLRVDHLSHSEGWAAGSWFVPIMSLFRPFQIMKEIYEETKNLLLNKGLIQSGQLKTTLLGWWWGIFILNNVVGQIVYRTSINDKTAEEIITSTNVSIVSNLIGILLAIITVKVIKDYSDFESILEEMKEDEEEIQSITEENFFQLEE